MKRRYAAILTALALAFGLSFVQTSAVAVVTSAAASEASSTSAAAARTVKIKFTYTAKCRDAYSAVDYTLTYDVTKRPGPNNDSYVPDVARVKAKARNGAILQSFAIDPPGRAIEKRQIRSRIDGEPSRINANFKPTGDAGTLSTPARLTYWKPGLPGEQPTRRGSCFIRARN